MTPRAKAEQLEAAPAKHSDGDYRSSNKNMLPKLAQVFNFLQPSLYENRARGYSAVCVCCCAFYVCCVLCSVCFCL